MNCIFETSRFYLRELTPQDAQDFFDLNSDPEVVRYTGDGPFDSVETARAFLTAYPDYKLHRMGRWAVIDKETGEFHGWSGLKFLPEHQEVDVGYRLFRRSWRKGIATETALASLAYGFDVLKLNTIVAQAAVENGASLRVLEKIGMKRVGVESFRGLQMIKFSLDRK